MRGCCYLTFVLPFHSLVIHVSSYSPFSHYQKLFFFLTNFVSDMYCYLSLTSPSLYVCIFHLTDPLYSFLVPSICFLLFLASFFYLNCMPLRSSLTAFRVLSQNMSACNTFHQNHFSSFSFIVSIIIPVPSWPYHKLSLP